MEAARDCEEIRDDFERLDCIPGREGSVPAFVPEGCSGPCVRIILVVINVEAGVIFQVEVEVVGSVFFVLLLKLWSRRFVGSC